MNWKELYALVNENIKNAVSGLYKPAGDVTFAELPELSQSVLGYTYTVTDAFTTDNRFTDYDTETQTGHSFPADTEVAVIVTGTTENPVYMFNVMGGIMDGYATKSDLTDYVQKEQGKGLSSNDFTDEEKQKLDGMIDDSAAGASTTYSSDKIEQMFIDEKSHFCYSYKIDMSDSNPATCVKPHFDTRYGCDNFNFTSAHMDYANDKFDYGSWEPFIRRIARPCMLKYDGTVDYYLDPDDYSKRITGEDSDVADVNYQGNAMVELEKLYFKRYTHNGIQYCFIADRKLDNSFKCYAHHDKYGKELDYIYRAAYDGSYDGTRLRSISGVDYHNLNALTAGYIMSNTTRQEEMNFAKANNVSTEQGEGWNILHKSEWDYINDILVLISMSTDTQGTFGRGRDSGHVSTSDTGIISTGTMDTKGLFWGKNDGSAGVKVLGIENHWANLFKSCAGWFNDKGTQKVKYTYGTEDGSTGEGFNTDASGYINITGATPTKGDSSTSGYGYITAWQYGEYGTIPYEAISGASNKYLCDFLYFNNTATCFALVGGASSDGLSCGAFCSYLYIGAGYRAWGIGAALSYKGQSGIN